MDQPGVDVIKNVLYSASLYFLHSRKTFSILIFQKILISFSTILTLFFLFFFRKISISLTSILVLFVFFFFKKILVPFTCFFLELFFVFLITVIQHFLYIEKKIIKNTFLYFCSVHVLYLIFFIRIFFIRICSIRIRRNFYVVSHIFRHLFSLTTYLHSSKNT